MVLERICRTGGGGIGTGIYVDSIPAEVKYIAGHSGAKFAIVNDQEQTDKFLEIKGELPELKKDYLLGPERSEKLRRPDVDQLQRRDQAG